MANQNAISNAIKAPESEIKGLSEIIERSSKELGRALPKHMHPERLVRIALTCIRANPELAKCTPASFMGALFTSAQLGIEPVAGLAYLLPFNNKRKVGEEWKTLKECQFILGYKGLANLFYRHEKAIQITWGAVYSKDDFEFEYGTNAYLRHRPKKLEGDFLLGFYVIAELKGGGKPFLYMTSEECLGHGKKHSKTYNKNDGKFYDNSPWVKDFVPMCLKTVLIQLGKLLPLSFEVQQAIAQDETSRDYKDGIKDALEIPSQTNWEDVEKASLPHDGKTAWEQEEESEKGGSK